MDARTLVRANKQRTPSLALEFAILAQPLVTRSAAAILNTLVSSRLHVRDDPAGQGRLLDGPAPRQLNYGRLSCYDYTMSKKPLIETNPYLKDSARYRRDLITSVSSSTAIETGTPVAVIARSLSLEPKALPVRARRGSSR